MFQSDKNNKNSMSSILGPEIEVKGDLKIKGDILIYGTVLGNVESKGQVHTSKGSLINGNMNAGYHSVVWNADSQASGVYFLEMRAARYVSTQKLMLVK